MTPDDFPPVADPDYLTVDDVVGLHADVIKKLSREG